MTYGIALYGEFALMVCLLGSDVGLSDMILSALTVVLVFGCLVSCDDVGKPCTYFGKNIHSLATIMLIEI